MKNQEHYNWPIKQKDIILKKILLLGRNLQEARKQIAKPYVLVVLVLKKKFPNTETYELIKTADEDLQKANLGYKQLTEKLAELQGFNQGPFQGLVKLTRQIQS